MLARLTIQDLDPRTGALSFDLADILAIIGPDVARSRWRAEGVVYTGEACAGALDAASDSGTPIDGPVLLSLANEVQQVIDGTFSARLPEEQEDWVIIRAVDSSYFEVITGRADVIAALQAHFTSTNVMSDPS